MTEVRHFQSARLPDTPHDTAYFCLLLEGDYRERLGAKDRTYRPFSISFCPAEFPHGGEICSPGARYFCVELTADLMASLADIDTKVPLTSMPIQHVRAFSALLRLYSEFSDAREDGHVVDSLDAESFAAELVGFGFDCRIAAERSRPKWLMTAIDYIEAHALGSISVRALAASAGVHPVHLARVFRQAKGCTIAQYVNTLRVRRACSLLKRRDLPLTQIAMDTGFADQAHFSRVFAATVGRPPGTFRRRTFDVAFDQSLGMSAD